MKKILLPLLLFSLNTFGTHLTFKDFKKINPEVFEKLVEESKKSPV